MGRDLFPLSPPFPLLSLHLYFLSFPSISLLLFREQLRRPLLNILFRNDSYSKFQVRRGFADTFRIVPHHCLDVVYVSEVICAYVLALFPGLPTVRLLIGLRRSRKIYGCELVMSVSTEVCDEGGFKQAWALFVYIVLFKHYTEDSKRFTKGKLTAKKESTKCVSVSIAFKLDSGKA